MNRAFLSDMRRQMIDSELSQHDGVARWTETVRYGGQLDCKLDGRHLGNVLRARANLKAEARMTMETVTVTCPCCLREAKVICYRSIIGWRAEVADHDCVGFTASDRDDIAFMALEKIDPPPPQAA